MCNRCVRFCPRSTKAQPVIFIGRNKKATVNEELCNGCGKCVRICREKAIEMVFVQEKTAAGIGKADAAQEAAASADAEKSAADAKQTAPSQAAAEQQTQAAQAQAPPKKTAPPKRKLTPEEKLAGKRSRHVERVIRTGIACVLGLLAGIASFYLSGTPEAETFVQPMAVIGLLTVVLAIVIQKSIFMFIKKIDLDAMGKKDWFYQGFMTVCCWFLSWTMLLTMYASTLA